MRLLDDPAEREAMEVEREQEEERRREAEFEAGRAAFARTLDRQTGMGLLAEEGGGDMARTS